MKLQAFLLVLGCFKITCHGDVLPTDMEIESNIKEYKCPAINEINSASHNSLEVVLNGSMDLNCSVISVNTSQSLSGNIIISSVYNMTIAGKSNDDEDVTVTCNNNSGISFWNFNEIILHNLDFIGCGVEYNLTEIEDGFNSEAAFIGVYFQSGSALSLMNCSFENGPGVGVVVNDVIGEVVVSNTVFSNNKLLLHSTLGGGLIIHTTNLSGSDPLNCLIDNCLFVNNQQSMTFFGGGGGLTLLQSQSNASGSVTIFNTIFQNNTASNGGGLHIANFAGVFCVTITACVFRNNTAYHGGGAWIVSYDTAITEVNITTGTFFNKNRGHRGGGLAVQTNATRKNAFMLYASFSSWMANTVRHSGSGVYLHAFTTFNGTANNYTEYTLASIFLNCSFIQNNIDRFHDIGAVYAESARVNFKNCEFNENTGTALYLQYSTYAILSGYISFQSNIGITASAIHVSYDSIVSLDVGITAFFILNFVSLNMGGAIYMEKNAAATNHTPCIFDDLIQIVKSGEYNVSFIYNRAKDLDRSIFLSDTTNCFTTTKQNLLLNNSVFYYLPSDISQIASIGSNITIKGSKHTLMPGQTFQIKAEIYDIFGNPSVIHGYILLLCIDEDALPHVCPLYKKDDYELVGPSYVSMDKYTQNNSRYYIEGPPSDESIRRAVTFLYDGNGDTFLDTPKSFNVIISNCLPGFSYNSSESICKCDNVENENLVCQSFDYSCIKSGYWYGVDSSGNRSVTLPCPGLNCQYNDSGCNNMPACPSSPGYCRLDSLSEQCYSGREGILCSNCQENFSFTFSALQCVNSSTCTASNTSLILFGILVYWILSITVIFMVLTLNLSIGSGFMYGIVYYFSIVSLYTNNTIKDTFLSTVVHTCTTLTQMSPRVIGHAGVCFAESWDHNLHHDIFNYVTPLFITTVILLLILFSSRLCRWPKRISPAENSPIHAISILILFSSSSLSYTSFEILKPLSIYDGLRVYKEPNYSYFGRDHIPYALVAVGVEVFLSLPICFLLLLAPCISKRLDLVKWKVKPILDEFQACYRSECRWFAGFYFLARQLVYLANSFSHAQSLPQENVVLHYLNVVILLVHVAFQPYTSRWLNILDAFLLADILMISFPDTNLPVVIDSRIQQAFMYILILLPTLYLLGIFIGLFFKRSYVCAAAFCTTKVPLKKMVNDDTFSSTFGVTHSTVAVENSDDSANSIEQIRDRSAIVDSFFTDHGEREPLLSRSQESHTENVTTMRLSSMAKLPHFLTNRNTNKATTN